MPVVRDRSGDQDRVTELVGVLLAAGGPAEIPARVAWPLHRALQDLDEEARRDGFRSQLPVLEFSPSPDGGLAASGVGRAVLTLLRDGVFSPSGTGRLATMRVDVNALSSYRRQFMRLDPQVAAAIHRAAMRWAALVATSAKNRSTAARSPEATRASSSPNRLQPRPGSASVASKAR
jgi:hypothetical protein